MPFGLADVRGGLREPGDRPDELRRVWQHLRARRGVPEGRVLRRAVALLLLVSRTAMMSSSTGADYDAKE